MSENLIEYDRLILEIGAPDPSAVPDAGFFSRFGTIYPQGYVEFVTKYGFGTFGRGCFQTTDPRQYENLLPIIFRNDRQFNPQRIHTVGMSAFGDLLLFHQGNGLIEITQAQHWASQSSFDASNSVVADFEVRNALYNFTIDFDNYDDYGAPLFARCLAAYGALRPGQIYAPRLATIAGGFARIEDFQIVDAAAAIAISAQWGPYELMDFVSPGGPKSIRTIGAR